MSDEQELYRQTEYQVLRKDEGYDVLRKGEVMQSFDDFGLAIASVASKVNKSEENIYVAPQADDPHLPAHECDPGVVFITSKTRGQILAECNRMVYQSMTQASFDLD